jgi:hypothetical protein
MNKPVKSDSGSIKFTLSKAAKALGTKGGNVSSPAKTQAVRNNGKLGGRPTKA